MVLKGRERDFVQPVLSSQYYASSKSEPSFELFEIETKRKFRFSVSAGLPDAAVSADRTSLLTYVSSESPDKDQSDML